MWQHGRGSLHQLSSPRHALRVISFMPQLQVHALATTICNAASASSEAQGCQAIGNPTSPTLVSRLMNVKRSNKEKGQCS